MRIRVIGVGTRSGDDEAGLRVAERLARESLPAGVEVGTCERTPVDLVDALADVDAAIVVDAVRSGRPLGTVLRVRPEALAGLRPASSHAVGVAEALALAGALHGTARVEVVAIEGDRARAGGLSPGVARGVDEACAQVRALAEEMLAALAAAPTPRARERR